MKSRSWLAAIVAACVMLCACSVPAVAAEISSAASGRYDAPDRACRVVLSRASASHIDVDLLCVTDAGVPTSARPRSLAPAGMCIGSPGVATVFALSGADPMAGYVALDAFDGQMLSVRRASEPLTIYQGGGVPEQWILRKAIPSPAPYVCPSPVQLPRIRRFGP